MDNKCMLTTFDNPFDPFEQFTSWFLFDVEKGYNTCGKLARIAKLSDGLSEKEVEKEVNRAIDEIITYDFLNIYKRVWSNSTTEG
nr:MAG TPA: Protein of unknown function (DUF4080) [Caudoviricetes sp.]